MNSPGTLLDQVVSDLDRVLSDDVLAGLSDAERIAVLQKAGAAFRRVEAVIVETVATGDPAEFAHSAGCRGMTELLQRTLRVDVHGATRIDRVVDLTRRPVTLTGERMPARWSEMRSAMLDGVVGVAGFLAATGPIERVWDRLTVDQRLAADVALAGCARGRGIDIGTDTDAEDGAAEAPGPAPTANDLRALAEDLASIFDPDGEEPKDEDSRRRRGITIGRLKDGVHAIRGYLTPDAAAQLQLIMDAILNPRGDGAPMPGAPMPGVHFTTDMSDDPGPDVGHSAGADHSAGVDHSADDDRGTDAGARTDARTDAGAGTDHAAGPDPFNSDPRCVFDDRTAAQKRHDALAMAFGIAARHKDMPSLGGASPVLVVNVDASDLAAGDGWATIPGSGAHVPVSVAAHVGCAGTIQRVLMDEGRIIGISTTDRVFTVHQRRAIIARDKECLIPGCHVPASWCEIHHVTEHARGGPTHTDNGVPLCWWHHRSLGRSGWEIRMDEGLPQVRGPVWWDPEQRWRTPRLSAAGPKRLATLIRAG